MSNNLVLKVIPANKNFQILEIELKSNGQIEPEDLKNLKLPKALDFTKGVIIFGKAPVWLFAFLSHELHIAKWVATFDPRIGAIVVQSHGVHSPQKGEIILPGIINMYLSKEDSKKKINKPKKPQKAKVISIVGPANSGKSVFIKELRKELNKTLGQKFRKEFFIIRACPDGEGDWFGDINPEEGKQFRHKKIFDDDFVNRIVQDLKNIKESKKYILVDCGGKIDKKNQLIFNESTHAIIVSGDKEKVHEWEGAIKASELELMAVIHSKTKNISKITGKREFEIGKLFRDNNSIKIPNEVIKLLI